MRANEWRIPKESQKNPKKSPKNRAKWIVEQGRCQQLEISKGPWNIVFSNFLSSFILFYFLSLHLLLLLLSKTNKRVMKSASKSLLVLQCNAFAMLWGQGHKTLMRQHAGDYQPQSINHGPFKKKFAQKFKWKFAFFTFFVVVNCFHLWNSQRCRVIGVFIRPILINRIEFSVSNFTVLNRFSPLNSTCFFLIQFFFDKKWILLKFGIVSSVAIPLIVQVIKKMPRFIRIIWTGKVNYDLNQLQIERAFKNAESCNFCVDPVSDNVKPTHYDITLTNVS